MKAGDTVILRFTAREEDGSLIDISGLEIVWQLSRSEKDEPIVVKTVRDGSVVVTNAAGGKFETRLTPEETADLIGDYYHEAKVVDWPDIWTVFSGTMVFEKALALPDALIAALNA